MTRILLLAAVLAASGAAPAPPAYVELPPGRYSVRLKGLVCTVCARAVAAEWSRLPELEKAAVNFDKDEATIVVRLDRRVKVASLRRALRRAERLANMGARLDLGDIVYLP